MCVAPTLVGMWGILIAILVVWLILSVVGFVVEGLFWLAVIGLVLFVVTLIFGAIKGRAKRN